MKKINFNLKSFTAGFFVCTTLCGGVVFAGSQFTLSQFDAKLVFNGTEKTSDKPGMYNNGSGYVPSALIYKGTTYVPLRFFADSSGLPVKYESKSKTIFVGKVPEDQRIQMNMSDIIKPFSSSNGTISAGYSMKMAGKEYNKGYQFNILHTENTGTFNLEAKYVNITGIVGFEDFNESKTATAIFIGDDKILGTVELKKGELPSNFNIDVTGVLNLKITCKVSEGYNYKVNLADVLIK